ncbi:hypothetical protein HMPREF0497_0254 [Lentilactobacillus buchneri ATCC 11577]|nr:hypothetical protein HMPREF0497_0254 [Lentilactobacillus buchneri ATCC 11577]KRK54585.1 hypothetical protein FD42_GL001097 [Lentilactobacillus hilgardii DSM 20176 = ATCC 8290]
MIGKVQAITQSEADQSIKASKKCNTLGHPVPSVIVNNILTSGQMSSRKTRKLLPLK